MDWSIIYEIHSDEDTMSVDDTSDEESLEVDEIQNLKREAQQSISSLIQDFIAGPPSQHVMNKLNARYIGRVLYGRRPAEEPCKEFECEFIWKTQILELFCPNSITRENSFNQQGVINWIDTRIDYLSDTRLLPQRNQTDSFTMFLQALNSLEIGGNRCIAASEGLYPETTTTLYLTFTPRSALSCITHRNCEYINFPAQLLDSPFIVYHMANLVFAIAYSKTQQAIETRVQALHL